MAQPGRICAGIDENINTNRHRRIRNAPVRHSAVETNGSSTQSTCEHSEVRCRRRKSPEPTKAALSRTASRSVGDLSFRSDDKLDLRVSSNGTLPLRVDTSDTTSNHMTGRKDYDCQNYSTDAKNAAGKAALAKPQSGTTDNKRTSDGAMQNGDIRTLSNGCTAGLSKFFDEESLPAISIDSVANIEEKRFNSDALNNNISGTSRSSIEYRRVPSITVNGFPVVEYHPKSNSDGTTSDAQNDETRIVPVRSTSDGALARAGDFEREREIERRMRELGLWDYKRAQERHLVDRLEAEISSRDPLTAAVRRGRRRQRGDAAAAADDIRCQVNQHFVR